MATLTPTSPVSFEDLLRVTCPDGYVINGTNDTSSDYPCLASRGFNVSRDMCVGELFVFVFLVCVCVCVCICVCLSMPVCMGEMGEQESQHGNNHSMFEF